MNYCFNPKLEAATPQFQVIKQKYDKYHYSPIYLAIGLDAFRRKYDRGIDWYPKTPSDYGLFTRFMKHEFNAYRRTEDERKMLDTELKNMYNILYQAYSPTVLKWRFDMLVNRFKQVVSVAVNNYNGRTPTRQRVIQSFGDKEHNPYVNIMKKVFDDMQIHDANVEWQFEKLKKLNPKMASTPEGLEKLRQRAEYRAAEASKMVEMKEQFAALVAPRIGEAEGFVVDITGHKVSFTSERDGTTEEGGTQKEDKGEDSEEGTKGDRYSDFRVLRLLETLSAKAKRFITGVPMVGVDNRVQFDDMGSYVHVQPRQAAIVLHKLLRHSTSESMMKDLEKAIPRYPWLRKLIEYLNANPEYKATIFTNFKKANTFYIYMNLVKGKMFGRVANSRSTGNVIAREAGNRMTRGDVLNEKYSVYGSDRLLIPLEKIRELEKELDSWREIPEIAELLEINMYVGGYDDNAGKIKSDIPHNKQRIKELLDAHPDFVERLAGGLQGLGLDIDEREVRLMALQELQKSSGRRTRDRYFYGHKRGLNRVAQIYEGIRVAMAGAESAMDEAARYKDKSLQAAQYFYSKYSEYFLYLNSAIALTKYAETEERVINEGKSLTTNNNFNLLHYLIDDLTYEPGSYGNLDKTVEEDYKKRLIEKFGRFEGMSLGYGKQMKLTGWLKWLYDTPAERDGMQLVDQCGFNHVEYADMSKAQHIVAAIMMYFNKRNHASSGAKLSRGFGFYEVPIQADYSTAYNFVSAPTYWGVGIGGLIYEAWETELEYAGKEDVELVEAINEKYKKMLAEQATDRTEDGRNFYYSDKRLIIKIDGKVYGTEIVEKLGEEVLIELERIQAIRERKANKDYKLSLGTYDEQGLLFQIFPEFNTNGFEEKYTACTSEVEAHNFLLEQIAAQLEKVLEQDVKTMDDNNIWGHPAIQKLQMEDALPYTDNSVGEHTKFSELSGRNQKLFYEYFLNVFYARQQMCKLFTGGMHQFNGLLDYEKRNMLLHAPHGAMYVNATDRYGNPVGQRTQNAVYVADDIVKSSMYEDADQMLQQLEDDEFITKEQHKKLLASYENIKSTDGQGFRTFESYRRIMMMMDKWKPEQESAYQTIKNYSEGKVSQKQLREAVSVLIDGIKPVYTGFEVVPAYPGQKPVRMTVLHKYSETVLLPLFLAEHCISLKSVPMQAFAKVEKAMKDRGKSVDLFITYSGVKCGAFSVINPFEKDKETGERELKSADEIADFMIEQIESTPGAIHTLDLENSYGEAASVSHDPKDERIAMASQAEKVGWADIQEGDTVEVRGKKIDASRARDIFYNIKTADIVSMYQKLREFFVTPRDVDKALKEQLSSKSYVPMDLQFALTHLRLGDFAMPFFAPNVEHQIQELFSSMIKKKLTKPFAAGANILQTTGVGLDFDAHGFDNSTALSDEDKLRVVFEGEGKNKHIKYVEVFLPLTDSRLKLFADEDGKITPARLRELVKDGTIPESMLEFVAYRTPSDAAHSLIPCRVKGFTSPIDGPSIKMPRDIMVMTGHDYDGDKVRCHFKTFKLVEKDAEETELTDDEVTQMILGQKPVDVNFKKCVVEEYDYSKSSSENSATARANAKVELLFAQLTSPAGSRRVIIPGGSGVTATYAKAHFMMSMLKDEESQEKVKKALVKVMKMSSEEAEALIDEKAKLYKYLTTTAADKISKIANVINENITPFSFTHEADAFEYMMEYADMIGIYAMYNSAFQMLQRVDLHYQPTVSLKGNVLEVSLFGHTFDKLFALKDTKGNLASLALARLINVAVDNGKDPLLGYLHQSAKTSELTFFLLASGLSEEQVHLIMNQPIMIELCRRLSEPQAGGFIEEATNLLSEFPDTIEDVKKVSDTFKYWGAVKTAGKLSEEDLASMLGVPLTEIKNGEDIDMMVSQCSLLNTMIHLYGPATDLSKLVRFTRPESAKGAFGSDIASLIAKKVALDKFRNDVDTKLSKSGNTIFGANEILKERPVSIGWEDEYFMDIIGDILPEVVALNSFMLDNGLDMFQSYFPQARRTWLNMIKKIAGLYDYSTINKELISKIANDMFLWKLLSNKNFVQGNPQEVQKDIIVNVPKRLLDIQRRITKAHKNPGTDPAAEKLYGNVFLNKLSATDPTADTLPRLIFRMEGAPAEGIRDVISSSWGQLAMSSDEDIRQLAVDLFRYNIYTHGWNYGMYEFAHFAPCNVLWATPGYVKSLQEMLKSSWEDENDNTNFLHYYIMNHWGDSKLVPSIQSTFVSLKNTTQGLTVSSMNPNVITAILENPYIIINYTKQVNAYGKKRVVPELYRVIGAGENGTVIITPAPKLGYRTKRGQMTIQYNPSVDYTEAKPVVTGDDSAWGTLSPLYRRFIVDSNANVEASGQPVTDVETAIHNRLSDFFGYKPSIKEQKKAEDKAAGIVRSDSELDRMAKRADLLSGRTDAAKQKIIVEQLVEHLRKQGINVYDRAAMAEFLKTHDIKLLQQMTDTKASTNNNGKIFAGKNGYGTNRSTEENQHFPEILGQSGKGKEAGRTLAEAADDTRRSQPDDGRQEGFPKEKFLAYLEVRARQNGTWIEDIRSIGSLLRRKGGAENEVYLSKDGKSYIKLNNFTLLDDKHNIEEFIDRINSHNEFAPNAAYEVLGFAENSDGSVCVVLKQPIIKGTEASQSDIDAYLEEIGFEKKRLSDGTKGWSNGTYELWDADPANVLEDSEGNLYFIDAVINNIERLQQSRAVDNIQFFITPQGEVYGFVDKDGNIYLDETKISPEHPIHEYTHLWDRAVQKRNPELWKRGVELMKQSSLWNIVLNSQNYGKNWQEMGITGERLDNLIASEIHARLTGKQGANILKRLEANGSSNIVERLKKWVLDFWKALKATFGGWTQEELNSLTLIDFNNMTVRDFANGTSLLESESSFDVISDKLFDSEASFEEAENAPAIQEDAEQQYDSTFNAEDEIRKKVEEATRRNMFKGLFGHIKIVQKLADGEYDVVTVPATPNNVREARKQRSFVRLNARLREILSNHGIAIGVLDNIEAREGLSGVTVFDRARVTAEGLLELIRIANDQEGERALPEEFAHLALEMLGHDHPLVKRLLAELSKNDKAMQEAYDGMYDEYLKRYGDQKEKLILEAAGKLVAKHLFQYQESKEGGVRNLIRRVCEAIKSLFRKFRTEEIRDAILDADDIASKIAREMLGGRLADDMSLDNISTTGEYYSIQNTTQKQKKDLSEKHDVLSELHKVEIKRLAVLKKRAGRYDENHKPKSIIAAEQQVDKLAKAIANNKTEEAIVTYINDSLTFLAEVEKSLDEVINNGKPINAVCAKLNITRDTLYSFAVALDYIQKAIDKKEVQDTTEISESIKKLSPVLNAFNIKYTKLARTYFEEMLSSVYGEHGITKEIGEERGRHISIHEMATKADRDISLIGRWFSAIKDCNDYVLKAIDEIVRDAKVRARLRTNNIRPRIEVAVADLIRETGSRDQSFMFEKKVGKDGKLHRTGKYISAEKAKNLSAAQQKFYNTMMDIKKDADSCLPASIIVEDGLGMVMVRKYTWDRFVAAEGAGAKALTAWEGLVNRVLDTSDSFDPDYKEVAKDFEGNKVDMLPIKFVHKGASESFDDMTEDVAGSMMAYAGMAYQYNELNGVVNTIENAKYMAGERDVIQKTGNRTERETIQTDEYEFRQPFTRKAARLHAQEALNDFISMHLYGHTAADEGTFGKTRISKRKVVDAINALTSLSQMALNLPQRISNVTTGGLQVFIESAGKGVYNAKDVSWATAIYMKHSADRLAQTGNTDYDNKLSLWDEHFDIHQDNGRHKDNYKKGWLSRVFNSNLLYAGLTIGEDYLSSITSLAAARNFKVKDANGKESNLWEAYEVRYTDPANKTGAYLALKDGYTKMDGTPITSADELAFSKQVWSLNFDMQGIYNLDDRSAVQQYALGALIIMYRKWIAPALKRRYGSTQYNMLTKKEEEGYYTTMWHLVKNSFSEAKDAVTEEGGAKALLNIINDVKAMCAALSVNWDKLTPYEKSNMKKALTELTSVFGLFLATSLLLRLPPDDHDGDEFLCWLDQLALSQLLRLRSELGAQAPTPMFVAEGMRILKSPFAAIGPLKSTLNMFQLLLPSNYMTTIKSGRYKGHVRAYKYLREFPILTMYKKVENFINPSSTIQYYSTDSGQWDIAN